MEFVIVKLNYNFLIHPFLLYIKFCKVSYIIYTCNAVGVFLLLFPFGNGEDTGVPVEVEELASSKYFCLSSMFFIFSSIASNFPLILERFSVIFC